MYKHVGKITLIVPQDGIVYVRDRGNRDFILTETFEDNAVNQPREGMPIFFNSNDGVSVSSYLIKSPAFKSAGEKSYGPV